jgi:hypothetical protein
MHHPTLVKWADLLGPLFPSDAEVALSPQMHQISIRWVPRDESGQPAAQSRSVAIFISPTALKDYRNAQDGQQARADRKLFALVHSNLKRRSPIASTSDAAAEEDSQFRIAVASVDILSR